VQFPVTGSSMYPTLKKGDILTVKPINHKHAKIGDILAYENFDSKRILVHRLVKKIKVSNQDLLLTIGEAVAPRYYDPPLKPDNCVIARVVFVKRGERLINLEKRWAIFQNRIRAFLVLRLPLVIVIQRKSTKAIESPRLVLEELKKYFGYISYKLFILRFFKNLGSY